MEQLNIVRTINNFRKILTFSSNIGFFFGAGTSCSFGLPDIAKLTSDVKNMLSSDEQQDFEIAEKSVEMLTGVSPATIEGVLNYLRQIRSITGNRPDRTHEGISGKTAQQLDVKICASIFEIIKIKEQTADISELRRFFSWLNTLNRSNTKEIYTANYDMLFERAMEANYIPYFDGFVGAHEPFFCAECVDSFVLPSDMTANWIRLWKVHGSLNWEEHISDNHPDRRIVRTGEISKPKNELMIYPSREKYELSRKQPYIAYFDRLKAYLLRGELLFLISGYSFGDQHINSTILECLRQNARLYVVVFCYKDEDVQTLESYGKSHLNLGAYGPTKVLANGIIYEWEYDDTEDEAEKPELYWDAVESKCVIGDFKKMIKFIIDNSGQKTYAEGQFNGK